MIYPYMVLLCMIVLFLDYCFQVLAFTFFTDTARKRTHHLEKPRIRFRIILFANYSESFFKHWHFVYISGTGVGRELSHTEFTSNRSLSISGL